MRARDLVGILRVVVTARQATQPDGIDPLESILELHKKLKNSGSLRRTGYIVSN